MYPFTGLFLVIDHKNYTKRDSTPKEMLYMVRLGIKDKLYPGVQTFNPSTTRKVFIRNYKWVVFVLLLESVVAYLPTWGWKELEGGKIKQICVGMLRFSSKQDHDTRIDRYTIIYYIEFFKLISQVTSSIPEA